MRLNLKLLCTLFLGFWFLGLSARGETAELPSANFLSLGLGVYQLKATTSSFSGVGALSVQYIRRLSEHLGGTASFASVLDGSGGFSVLISGFDLGASYFLPIWSQVSTTTNLLEVTERTQWGAWVSAGISERTFALSNETLVFSGPFLQGALSYRWKGPISLQTKVQYSALKNTGNSTGLLTAELGLGFDF
jgi:hypothetical protein